MKIAFFSYEYPPETGGGGIGTYLVQMVINLPIYGHFPVVFCATAKQEAFWENENVYRIPALEYETYNRNLPLHFNKINDSLVFDIAEGSDFRACGIEVMRQFPHLAFVVRAHTANYLIDKFLFNPLSLKAKTRFILGGLKKFKVSPFPKPPQECNYLVEKEFLKKSDLVLSPSTSLGEIYQNIGWCESFCYLPYLFEPTEELLSIESDLGKKDIIKIIFYGRLEIRKGVIDIAKAIPSLIKKFSKIEFYFYGNSANSPKSGIDMKSYLEEKLIKFKHKVFFKGAFESNEISKVLNFGDIFLFPSKYDNSPLACLEAMSAGKAVIGSRNGGMAEIIEEGVSGLLVSPNNPKQIIEAITMLVKSREKRVELGINARKRILETYSAKKIIPEQIRAYQQVIDKKNRESTKFS